MTLHHIAYAVQNIDKAVRGFELLGFVRASDTVSDEARGVKIVFMELKQGASFLRIELVAPLRENSPVSTKLSESKGVSTPYHLCFETDNIEETSRELVQQGVLPISNVAPAPAIANAPVQFLFNSEIGLIELVEVGENE